MHDRAGTNGEATEARVPAILRWGAAAIVALLGLAALAVLALTIVAITRLA